MTKPITYAARDGTTIPGYLTVPAAASQTDAPPLIVMPHGGPAARDIWGFNPMVQYLASQGYAVLQMNYRGSAGYGTQFRTAGRDWSGLPYSDMIDGLKWAIAQKFGDPVRVCVVGASFGGYLALSAAVRDSALFRCAVSIAGVSDLGKLEDERSWFGGSRLMRELLRNTDFKESPRRHPEEVHIPVLLIQGDEDSTVNPEQASLMDAALAHAGNAHRLVIVPGADHYFSEDAYFEKMLSEIGAFLHENLDAGTAAMTSTTTSAAAANSSAAH